MSAMIIDLRTERLLRRGTRAAAARADARDAAPEETCPVLLFHRRPARTAPSTGPRHRADQRR